METVATVLEEIKANGSESAKIILMKHGAREPFYGTRIEYLKKIQKKIKNNQQLAMDLYETGISDAMYLAGLVANGSKMTREQLQHWAGAAYWYMLSEYTVPWVTAENADGWSIGVDWIDAVSENVAAAGWATLSNIISVTPDDQLDIELIRKLLGRVEHTIQTSPNRVRYVMNNFIICTGGYIADLRAEAIATALKIGPVYVDMGDTACKVPEAVGYIQKMQERGSGKKKKLKC